MTKIELLENQVKELRESLQDAMDTIANEFCCHEGYHGKDVDRCFIGEYFEVLERTKGDNMQKCLHQVEVKLENKYRAYCILCKLESFYKGTYDEVLEYWHKLYDSKSAIEEVYEYYVRNEPNILALGASSRYGDSLAYSFWQAIKKDLGKI